jgi:hypothetical protein
MVVADGGSVAAKFKTIIFTREERRIIQKAANFSHKYLVE